MNAKQHVKPHLFEALIINFIYYYIISYCIMKLGSVPHIPILISIISTDQLWCDKKSTVQNR